MADGLLVLSFQPLYVFSSFLWRLRIRIEGYAELGTPNELGVRNLCRSWGKDCINWEIFVFQFIQYIFLKIKTFFYRYM